MFRSPFHLPALAGCPLWRRIPASFSGSVKSNFISIIQVYNKKIREPVLLWVGSPFGVVGWLGVEPGGMFPVPSVMHLQALRMFWYAFAGTVCSLSCVSFRAVLLFSHVATTWTFSLSPV